MERKKEPTTEVCAHFERRAEADPKHIVGRIFARTESDTVHPVYRRSET